jgi:RNA polymerase sigma-70 factor (ECF subfamily)
VLRTLQVDQRAAIESALQQVAEPYRSALVLVDVQGLSYEEASVSLGCAVGTVKSRVNRGRFSFRDHYQKADRHGGPVRHRGASS